jgi:hypothetical protein
MWAIRGARQVWTGIAGSGEREYDRGVTPSRFLAPGD